MTPKQILEAILESHRYVLAERGVLLPDELLAELANNAAQSIVFGFEAEGQVAA